MSAAPLHSSRPAVNRRVAGGARRLRRRRGGGGGGGGGPFCARPRARASALCRRALRRVDSGVRGCPPLDAGGGRPAGLARRRRRRPRASLSLAVGASSLGLLPLRRRPAPAPTFRGVAPTRRPHCASGCCCCCSPGWGSGRACCCCSRATLRRGSARRRAAPASRATASAASARACHASRFPPGASPRRRVLHGRPRRRGAVLLALALRPERARLARCAALRSWPRQRAARFAAGVAHVVRRTAARARAKFAPRRRRRARGRDGALALVSERMSNAVVQYVLIGRYVGLRCAIPWIFSVCSSYDFTRKESHPRSLPSSHAARRGRRPAARGQPGMPAGIWAFLGA